MSGYATYPSDRDALLERVSGLAPELFSLVVEYCVGMPTLIAPEYDTLPLGTPRYEPETRPSGVPRHFVAEQERLIRQKWLRSQKTFFDATPFIMTHLACLMHRGTFDIALQACTRQPHRLHQRLRPCTRLKLTGLENIELDMPTDVFFLLFKVTVPPFPTSEHLYHDSTFLGAGTYLAQTRKLTLNFTATNPWYDLRGGRWAEEEGESIQPGRRGNVCTSGLVIDWILSYAWHHNYLQHIQNIELKGDIQKWVKKKWTQVFAGRHPEQEDVASHGRIYDIEHHGEQELIAIGEFWDPTEHYPPTCHCKVNCSR